MNILVTCVGQRVNIIQYIKKSLADLGGKVIAVDCSESAPALYFSDHYEIVPPIHDVKYLDEIKRICIKNEVTAVISLIDPELPIYARAKEDFMKHHINIIVSDPRVIEICNDKKMTYQFLASQNIPTIPTYSTMEEMRLDQGDVTLPLILKPNRGSGSFGVKKVTSIEEANQILSTHSEYIVQPFIEGSEYSVEVYVDLISNETICIHPKKQLLMKAGETYKSVSVKDPILLELIQRTVAALGPIGPINIDCFQSPNGDYLISEINPRLGGSYPHTHEVGLNFIKYLIHNLNGYPNQSHINEYPQGTVMMKYFDVLVISPSIGSEVPI